MKKLGCCTLCEKEVYEIKTRWPAGLIEREPRKIGRPTADAIRVNYHLSDGSSMPLTFCADCTSIGIQPEMFPRVWAVIMEAFVRELSPAYVAAVGNQPRTPEQQESVERYVAELSQKCIIGVDGYGRSDENLWSNS